jgi:peptidoglycan/xylan/chitin deacetylase (PgdA/CDA1 family)
MAGVPILMYHALSAARTQEFHRWTLSGARLRDHLAYLSSAGYRTVTVSELTGRLHDAAPARVIALTFDDAYADFHEVALPLLARYGMTGTLFVPTGYVGGHSGWMRGDSEGDRQILSWTALAEIAGQGIEIGAHSHTHPALDRLSPEAMAGETSMPKAQLEDSLGVPVSAFAYPYGRYDRRVRDAVAAAGYRAACTMNSWAASPASHALELPRIAVFHYMSPLDLAQRLAASHDPARRAVLRAKRAAESPARLLRVLASRAHPSPPAEAA